MNLLEISPTDQAGLRSFHSLAAQVYANDRAWAPQSEQVVESLLAPGAGSMVRPLLCVREGVPQARAAAILNPNARDDRGAPLGYIGLFESLQQAPEAAQAILGYAERLLFQEGARTVQAPRVNNMLMGLVLQGFHLQQTILTPHNPPYYAAILETQGYAIKERLYTYVFNRSCAIDVPFRVPGYSTRVFNRQRLDEEIEVFHALECGIFQTHPGWVPRSLEEDRQMIGDFLPVLDDELVIIAQAQNGQPVGLLVCLPDVYQAARGQRIDNARLITIGALPGFANKGLGVLMGLHLARNLVAKGYQTLEASWIRDANIAPQNLAKRFAGRRGREFGIFEKRLGSTMDS